MSRQFGRRIKVIALVVLGLALVAAVVLPALAGQDDIQAQIDALNAKYAEKEESLPEGPARGPALTALNEEYEKEFAAIGTEAPNTPDQSPPPGDDNPYLPPEGIHPANENPEGFVLTNYWAAEFDDGNTIIVSAATAGGDDAVSGVYLADERGEQFHRCSVASGPMEIVSVDGVIVRLQEIRTGDEHAFNYETRRFES